MAKRARSALLILGIVSCGGAAKAPESAAAPGASSSPEDVAQASAESWLGMMDAGKYGDSWTAASSLFKHAIEQKDWEKRATGARGPLGKVESRTVKSRIFARTLPGAPDGEYVVVKYQTSFENKKIATETVTPMKEPDGTWRVSGYFVR